MNHIHPNDPRDPSKGGYTHFHDAESREYGLFSHQHSDHYEHGDPVFIDEIQEGKYPYPDPIAMSIWENHIRWVD